tara:strand:- start:3422 stop:4609 length:1188 start_codon:yes stop_codon:yes gene_type:complete
MSVTTPSEALDWLLNSSKNLLDDVTSVFQNKTSFKIRVLTEPYPLAGPATLSDSEDSKSLSEEGVESKFVFKGRILDREMAHQKFLEDPCDTSVYGGDKTKLALLINNHSTIILNVASNLAGFSVGDIIVGEAEPGDNNTLYDLQILTMTEISDIFKDSDTGTKFSDCSVLGDIFEDWGGETLTSFELPELSGEPIEIEEGSCPSGFVLMHPAAYEALVTSNFGVSRSENSNAHSGIDFGIAYEPLYASASGTVTSIVTKCRDSSAAVARLIAEVDPKLWAEESVGVVVDAYNGKYGDDLKDYFNCPGAGLGAGGNSVMIEHDGEGSGYSTFYAHMRQVDVVVGQRVEQGEFIGYSGNSGLSTGPHLHFELKQGGVNIDPSGFIKTLQKCETATS